MHVLSYGLFFFYTCVKNPTISLNNAILCSPVHGNFKQLFNSRELAENPHKNQSRPQSNNDKII